MQMKPKLGPKHNEMKGDGRKSKKCTSAWTLLLTYILYLHHCLEKNRKTYYDSEKKLKWNKTKSNLRMSVWFLRKFTMFYLTVWSCSLASSSNLMLPPPVWACTWTRHGCLALSILKWRTGFKTNVEYNIVVVKRNAVFSAVPWSSSELATMWQTINENLNRT